MYEYNAPKARNREESGSAQYIKLILVLFHCIPNVTMAVHAPLLLHNHHGIHDDTVT
jgi:hypothetical protein